jgi:hypothetical protein
VCVCVCVCACMRACAHLCVRAERENVSEVLSVGIINCFNSYIIWRWKIQLTHLETCLEWQNKREATFKSRDFVVFLFVDKNSHCGETARTWTTTIDEQNLWKSVTLFLYRVNDLAKMRGLRSVGMFAKLWKVRISFVMSVMLVHLRGMTRLPLDRFSWNLIFDCFFKFENSSFIKIWKE